MKLETSISELAIDQTLFKKSVALYRTINNKKRQTILHLLHHQGRLTVTSIYKQLRLSQSEVSQHLAKLRKAGLVVTSRNGKFVFYSVDLQRLNEFHQIAESFM